MLGGDAGSGGETPVEGLLEEGFFEGGVGDARDGRVGDEASGGENVPDVARGDGLVEPEEAVAVGEESGEGCGRGVREELGGDGLSEVEAIFGEEEIEVLRENFGARRDGAGENGFGLRGEIPAGFE